MDLVLTLDLSGHCIETELKRLYNRALAACLRPGGDKSVVEKTLELTREALARYDFGLLRSRYASLAGSSAAKVTLAVEQGEPVLRIDGRPADADVRVCYSGAGGSGKASGKTASFRPKM